MYRDSPTAIDAAGGGTRVGRTTVMGRFWDRTFIVIHREMKRKACPKMFMMEIFGLCAEEYMRGKANCDWSRNEFNNCFRKRNGNQDDVGFDGTKSHLNASICPMIYRTSRNTEMFE